MKVAVIFGTRPEAIKMAPVVHALARRRPDVQPLVYVTGQHREMLDQVLRWFEIETDADLQVMQPGQKLVDLTARILTGLDSVLQRDQPDMILVHGDTTTAFAGALAGFYRQIPVGHVEAGLRTGNRYSPFPEELNRALVGRLATWHFAPTARAVTNLRSENVSAANIVQTGNTVIDALLWTLQRLGGSAETRLLQLCPALRPALREGRPLILVTSHRRENLGAGLTNICAALRDLTERFGDVEILYPVHPNPEVMKTAQSLLGGQTRIHLLPPLDYALFCGVMNLAHIILTDSGGIQEEAPMLNKPVLVLRDTSERPEAVVAGAARVVGTERVAIVQAASELLTDPAVYRRMAQAPSPYGDGNAAERVVDSLLAFASGMWPRSPSAPAVKIVAAPMAPARRIPHAAA